MAENPTREQIVLNALFGMTERLSVGANLEEVLKDLARLAYKLCAASTASVMVLDASREALLCRVGVGLPPNEIKNLGFKLGEGIAGWVVQNNEPLRLADAVLDDRFMELEGQRTVIRGICCVPLATSEGVMGALTLTSPDRGAFSGEDQAVLLFLAGAIAKDLESARLYRIAVTDPESGAYNRQYLAERLPSELERQRRYGHPLSMIFLGLDRSRGQTRAQEELGSTSVARWLASIISNLIREVDSLVRYSDDEFLVLLPTSKSNGAHRVAERIRTKVLEAHMGNQEQSFAVTASLGIVQLAAEHRGSDEFLMAGLQCLAEARASGGNRSVVACARERQT